MVKAQTKKRFCKGKFSVDLTLEKTLISNDLKEMKKSIKRLNNPRKLNESEKQEIDKNFISRIHTENNNDDSNICLLLKIANMQEFMHNVDLFLKAAEISNTLENIKQKPIEFEESNNLKIHTLKISNNFIVSSFSMIQATINVDKKTFSLSIYNSIGKCLNYQKLILNAIEAKNSDVKFHNNDYKLENAGNKKFLCDIIFTDCNPLKLKEMIYKTK